MKKIFFIYAIIFSISAQAQVSKVSLQASGLTCSMCSNAINKALKTLDFVENIDADIKTSTFEITFKNGKKTDFDKLKNKVEDAGFTVSKFIAFVYFNNVQVSNAPVSVGDNTFKFMNIKEQQLNGEKPVRIIDKGFVSAKEYKKNPIVSPGNGKVYNVVI